MADAPKPDLAAGTPADSLADGQMLVGRVGEDDVLLARAGDRFFAVSPYCTHYHGLLADGLIVGDTVRCPLHHACFSLATGDALRAPALDSIACWRVASIDAASRTVALENGSRRQFGALLIATGADPVRLAIPGADDSRVCYLRTFADSRAIVERTGGAKRVVVVGASFIGLEVAASLRARDVAVHVVAPETVPLERVMGPEIGRFVQSLHEAHGVVFHLGQTAA